MLPVGLALNHALALNRPWTAIIAESACTSPQASQRQLNLLAVAALRRVVAVALVARLFKLPTETSPPAGVLRTLPELWWTGGLRSLGNWAMFVHF